MQRLKAEECVPVPGEPTQWRAPDGTILCGRVGQSLKQLVQELNRDHGHSGHPDIPVAAPMTPPKLVKLTFDTDEVDEESLHAWIHRATRHGSVIGHSHDGDKCTITFAPEREPMTVEQVKNLLRKRPSALPGPTIKRKR